MSTRPNRRSQLRTTRASPSPSPNTLPDWNSFRAAACEPHGACDRTGDRHELRPRPGDAVASRSLIYNRVVNHDRVSHPDQREASEPTADARRAVFVALRRRPANAEHAPHLRIGRGSSSTRANGAHGHHLRGSDEASSDEPPLRTQIRDAALRRTPPCRGAHRQPRSPCRRRRRARLRSSGRSGTARLARARRRARRGQDRTSGPGSPTARSR